MRKPRVVLFGLGTMNSIVLRLLAERGAEVVGAIARSPEKVGRDAGEVAGLAPVGVEVEADAAAVLAASEPDVAVVATASYLSEVEDQLALCLAAGVDTITLAEEMLFPWRTAPAASERLDRLAKENGATLVGGGYQDVYLVHLVSVLLGSAHRVEAISGLSTFDVDDFGPEIARDQQVGKSAAEFGLWLREAERPPSFGGNVLDALADAAGLSVERTQRTTRPVFAEVAMRCESLDLEVPPGAVIGFADSDRAHTAEGPVLSIELSGRLYRKGESDVNEWRVAGEPSLHLRNPAVDTRLTTCTQLVNRIPDLLDAPPGLLAVTELPPPRLRPGPLGSHVESWG